MTVTLRPAPLSPAGADRPGAVAGLGCVALFLLPFAAIGVFNMGAGVLRLLEGSWREGLTMMLFGAAFAGFAGGFAALIVLGLRQQKTLAVLREKYPDQPWLWRPDWAAGRISDSNRHTGWAVWVFAILWNLVSVPAAAVGIREALRDSNPMLYLVLAFPAIGLGFVVWAVRSTVRSRRYGTSQLELTTTPGTIGRSLSGTVRVNGLVQPPEGFEVTLSCIRRVTTRSGKNSSTNERILWQEDKRVQGSVSRDAAGMATRLPIAFHIPGDALASDASEPRDQIVWRLTLSASVPGVDYASTFEVPVFRTADSDRPATVEEARAASEAALELADYRPPADSRITVTTNRRGTEIYFPAARNPGAAMGATVFTLIWTGVVIGLAYSGAPLGFPIVFGLLDLLIIMGTLQLWFGVARVTAGGGSLVVASGYFYPSRERSVAAADVADVTIRIGMQSGSKPYYDVVVVRKVGKRLTAGRGIPNKREAEWLTLTLRAALGLTTSTGQISR